MTGTIEGTISNNEGDTIEDATITIADAATEELEATTTTNETGQYSVSVAPDTYDVRSEKIGFTPDEERVTVSPGVTKTVDLTLVELSADVVGEITNGPGIGVLGTVRNDSGSSIGVQGEVTSDAGYGLYTPNDARIDGTIDTIEEWQVTINGERGLRVEAFEEFKAGRMDFTGSGSAVVGHLNNVDSGAVGAVISGGGLYNQDDEMLGNRVTGHVGTIGGGADNIAGDDDPLFSAGATVGGGWGNTASDGFATVGGGIQNTASGGRATVGGGNSNTASSRHATVGGGWQNTAAGDKFATIGGGGRNKASDNRATVSGGAFNEAEGNGATVGGGSSNTAGRRAATVSGGARNEAGGDAATVGGGGGNTASGRSATVPGGNSNTADGNYSFAAGRVAKANHNGAFVFGDSSHASITSNGSDEARFQMEVHAPSFNRTSTRSAKMNVEPVDPLNVLEGVKSLEVSTWEFHEHDTGRHMGPMAGEFAETFGLGDDNSIATVDSDGVALAAIQGLAHKLNEKDERIADLEERLSALESQVGADETAPTGD